MECANLVIHRRGVHLLSCLVVTQVIRWMDCSGSILLSFCIYFSLSETAPTATTTVKPCKVTHKQKKIHCVYVLTYLAN